MSRAPEIFRLHPCVRIQSSPATATTDRDGGARDRAELLDPNFGARQNARAYLASLAARITRASRFARITTKAPR